MTVSTKGATPVLPANRILSLDVLRGIALFGILLANVHQMFLSITYGNDPIPVVTNEVGIWFEWSLFYFLIDLKFLTIFSLLFGVGFALQWGKSSFTPWGFRLIYIRRLILLALFGVFHGMFLYAADVLTLYAMAGLLLMLAMKWSARKLLLVGLWLSLAMLQWSFAFETESTSIVKILYGFLIMAGGLWLVRNQSLKIILITSSMLLILGVGIQYVNAPLSHGSIDAFQTNEGKAKAVLNADREIVFIDGKQYPLPLKAEELDEIRANASPSEKAVIEAIAFRDGPGWLSFEVRSNYFFNFQFLFVLYLMWRTLGIFLIGAGLLKWGILDEDKAPVWRQTAKFGLLIGLPLSGLATWLKAESFATENFFTGINPLLHETSALILGVAFCACVLIWCSHGSQGWLQRGFAAAGKMALTNYIAQSAVMAFIASWYGLGLYAGISHLSQMGLAVLVFSGLMLASQVWLNTFSMGPLEWIWRLASYFRLFPLKRNS